MNRTRVGALIVVTLAACAEPTETSEVQEVSAEKVSLCHATGVAAWPYTFLRRTTREQHADHPADFVSTDPSCDPNPRLPNLVQRPPVKVDAYPRAIAIADLDEDGISDLVVANNQSASVSVALGNGDGTYAPSIGYSAPYNPHVVSIGRFDGDAHLDVLVVDHSRISVLLGNGDGTLRSPLVRTVFDGQIGAAAAHDLDGDGDLDLVLTRFFPDRLQVWLGNGDATFGEPVSYSVAEYSFGIAIADVTSDGIPDVIAANNSGVASFLRGTGTATLAPMVALYAGGGAAISVGDVNLDAKPDLVTGHGGGAVAISLGHGDGTFDPPRYEATHSQVGGVAIGDVTADGIPDIVASNVATNDISVIVGTRFGGHLAALQFGAGRTPWNLALGHLDGDDKLDIAVVNQDGGDVSLLLQAPTDGVGLTVVTDGTGQGVVTSNPAWIVCGSTCSSTFPAGSTVTLHADAAAGSEFTGWGGACTGVGACTVTMTAAAQVTASFALAAGGFVAGPNVPAAPDPRGVAAGDLDGDGDNDLVTAHYASSSISVVLNNGGTFAAPVTYAVGRDPQDLLVGDFNNDGTLDIATANANNACCDLSTIGSISILVGNGDGTFGLSVELPAGHGPIALASGDFNGDGRVDLAIANQRDGATIFVGNGDGSFGAGVALSSPYPGLRAIEAADLDGDGLVDLVGANENNNKLIVWRGDGNSGFVLDAILSVGAGPQSIAIGDLDADGDQDLVVAAIYSGGSVNVLLRSSAGYAPFTSFSAGANPVGVAVADFDRDGALDIAATNLTDNTVSILFNAGAGSFGAPVNYATVPSPHECALADFNGDSIVDLATVGYGSSDISILFGN